MANKIIYSSSNPLQMFIPDFDRDERYNSKDFEDFEFPETILPWEQITSYCQPWQLNDNIPLQLQSNIGPVNFIIKDCLNDKVLDTILFDTKQESENEPGMFIREVSAPLTGYPEGCYYVELDFGGVFTLRSGEQNFSQLHENTGLIQYKHFETKDDIIYETGFFPNVRVHATKRYDRSPTKKTVYEDQRLNLSLLHAQKTRQWNLVFGESYGIPDYKADMLAGIVHVSDFRYDGKNYTVPEEEDLEPNGEDYYPMKGWSVVIRDRYTRGSRTFENDEPIDGQIAVMVNVDSKGFGNSNAGIETAIIDVQ